VGDLESLGGMVGWLESMMINIDCYRPVHCMGFSATESPVRTINLTQSHNRAIDTVMAISIIGGTVRTDYCKYGLKDEEAPKAAVLVKTNQPTNR
jgi:hypothetical protein